MLLVNLLVKQLFVEQNKSTSEEDHRKVLLGIMDCRLVKTQDKTSRMKMDPIDYTDIYDQHKNAL